MLRGTLQSLQYLQSPPRSRTSCGIAAALMITARHLGSGGTHISCLNCDTGTGLAKAPAVVKWPIWPRCWLIGSFRKEAPPHREHISGKVFRPTKENAPKEAPIEASVMRTRQSSCRMWHHGSRSALLRSLLAWNLCDRSSARSSQVTEFRTCCLKAGVCKAVPKSAKQITKKSFMGLRFVVVH